MLELENTRNMKTDLLNLLEMAYRERDQAREQLQILVKKLVPSTSNKFYEPQHDNNNNLVMFQTTKANSSITESNSPSHVSSPVDSLIEAVSSPEFSNIGVDSHNMCFYKKNLGHDFNGSLNKCEVDIASGVIDLLAKGKVLPQKGKLLEAVINAGPLLQNLVLSGPLPTWKNPPPLSSIKIPPFGIKEIDELNSFQNSTIQCSHSSGSTPILNIASVTPSSCHNNTWELTSNSCLKKQKLQYF